MSRIPTPNFVDSSLGIPSLGGKNIFQTTGTGPNHLATSLAEAQTMLSHLGRYAALTTMLLLQRWQNVVPPIKTHQIPVIKHQWYHVVPVDKEILKQIKSGEDLLHLIGGEVQMTSNSNDPKLALQPEQHLNMPHPTNKGAMIDAKVVVCNCKNYRNGDEFNITNIWTFIQDQSHLIMNGGVDVSKQNGDQQLPISLEAIKKEQQRQEHQKYVEQTKSQPPKAYVGYRQQQQMEQQRQQQHLLRHIQKTRGDIQMTDSSSQQQPPPVYQNQTQNQTANNFKKNVQFNNTIHHQPSSSFLNNNNYSSIQTKKQNDPYIPPPPLQSILKQEQPPSSSSTPIFIKLDKSNIIHTTNTNTNQTTIQNQNQQVQPELPTNQIPPLEEIPNNVNLNNNHHLLNDNIVAHSNQTQTQHQTNQEEEQEEVEEEEQTIVKPKQLTQTFCQNPTCKRKYYAYDSGTRCHHGTKQKSRCSKSIHSASNNLFCDLHKNCASFFNQDDNNSDEE